MMDGWITKHVFKDLDRGNITIRQHSETKLVSIKDNETDEQLHIARHRLNDIAAVLLEIVGEPATVDGMTALKHIMDGGGAYRTSGQTTVRVDQLIGSRIPHFVTRVEHGLGGHISLVTFNAADIAATDWVLVP